MISNLVQQLILLQYMCISREVLLKHTRCDTLSIVHSFLTSLMATMLIETTQERRRQFSRKGWFFG